MSISPASYPMVRPELARRLVAGDARLAELMADTSLKYRARDEIAAMGEKHERVYRLRAGWVARSRSLPNARAQIIMIFVPGDLFAIKAMFLAAQPDAIEALTDVEFAWVDQARLRAAFESDPDVALRIAFQVVEEERRLHNRVVRLGRGNAEERFAGMILAFRGRLIRAGVIDGDAREVPLPMTQQQIADFLGMTSVHVNRVLRRLRVDSIAAAENGHVRLIDLPALEALARPLQDSFEQARTEYGGFFE